MRLARSTFTPYKPKKEVNVGYGIQSPPKFNSAMLDDFYFICPEVRGKNYILFLSRVDPKKGLDLIINAYLTLVKNPIYLDKLPHLVIAGPGIESDYGKQNLKLIASNPEVRSKIHIAGMLTGNAKWGAIYGSEVFILPSHQENFGIAVVESMACSKPVLITNKVNIWHEIIEESGGMVCEDNLDSVKELIIKWLSFSDDEKLLMGSNAHFAFKKHFQVNGIVKNILNTVYT
jgi:glycosyltransferase involved in cell wall biosynthesis